MRIFLIGWAIAAIIIWIELTLPFAFLGSRDGQSVPRSVVPPVAQHVAMGVVIGLVIGTTDWTALRFVGWWQFWWTVPLLLAYAGLFGTRRRSSRSRP